MTATGSKSPTRFSPYVMEGVAASERNSIPNSEGVLKDELETSAASHHSTSSQSHTTSFYEAITTDATHTSTSDFDYSTNSLSPTQSRADLKEAAQGKILEEEVISPGTVA